MFFCLFFFTLISGEVLTDASSSAPPARPRAQERRKSHAVMADR